MTALAALIPVSVVGIIVWVVLVLTRRGSPFTLATAASLYAHWMMIAGATMTLAGVAIGIKLLIAQINNAFAYFVPQSPACPPGATEAGKCLEPNFTNGVAEQMRQDLVLAIVLLVIGAAVLAFHFALARALRSREGGGSPIVVMGSLVAFTVLYGLVGLVSLAAGLYSALNYAVAEAGTTPGPFADSVGAAIAFTPAWAFAAVRLLRATQHPGSPEVAPAH